MESGSAIAAVNPPAVTHRDEGASIPQINPLGLSPSSTSRYLNNRRLVNNRQTLFVRIFSMKKGARSCGTARLAQLTAFVTSFSSDQQYQTCPPLASFSVSSSALKTHHRAPATLEVSGLSPRVHTRLSDSGLPSKPVCSCRCS